MTKTFRQRREELKSYGFTLCRVASHAWELGAIRAAGPYERGRLVFEFSCLRCRTTRTDFIGSRGDVEKRDYGYASGYLVPSDNGDGPPDKATWRRQLVSQRFDS